MCNGCNPGLTDLARVLLSDLDLSEISKAAPTPESTSIFGHTTTLFHNGSIITMAGGSFSPVEALAITGNTITATGTYAEVQSLVGTKDVVQVDLQGQCIVPGFIEPHLHWFLSALTVEWLVTLVPWTITTLQDAINVLTGALANLPSGSQWLAAYGYDPSLIEGHVELTIDILDQQVSSTVGVFVLNQSVHIAYANSKAFELSNITAQNAPKGVEVVDGKLTGRLLEPAGITAVSNNIPRIGSIKFYEDCKAKLQKWSANGCTTVFDAGIGPAGSHVTGVETLTALTLLIKMPLRFVAAVLVDFAEADVGDKTPPVTAGRAQVQAIKFLGDGSTQGLTAALNEPYLADPSSTGTLNYPDDNVLQPLMQTWMEKGWQLSIHANGDRAIDQALRLYQTTFNNLPNRDKSIMHRIEHFTVCSEQQIQNAQHLGLGVSHTMNHVYYWGQTFKDWVLGDPRASRIDPIQDDVNNGLVYSFHSDSPLTEPDPLRYIRTAVTRLMYNSTDVLGKDQCVGLEDALKGVTINPAKQLGLSDTIGSLEKGKSADFVILAQDPRTVGTADLDKIKINQTWYQGDQVYQAS